MSTRWFQPGGTHRCIPYHQLDRFLADIEVLIQICSCNGRLLLVGEYVLYVSQAQRRLANPALAKKHNWWPKIYISESSQEKLRGTSQ
eukprot:1378100-Amorphochlora_amoeboformis.AAC.2